MARTPHLVSGGNEKDKASPEKSNPKTTKSKSQAKEKAPKKRNRPHRKARQANKQSANSSKSASNPSTIPTRRSTRLSGGDKAGEEVHSSEENIAKKQQPKKKSNASKSQDKVNPSSQEKVKANTNVVSSRRSARLSGGERAEKESEPSLAAADAIENQNTSEISPNPIIAPEAQAIQGSENIEEQVEIPPAGVNASGETNPGRSPVEDSIAQASATVTVEDSSKKTPTTKKSGGEQRSGSKKRKQVGKVDDDDNVSPKRGQKRKRSDDDSDDHPSKKSKVFKPKDKHKHSVKVRRNAEIRFYQRSADLLLPRRGFQRVVREISEDLTSGHSTIQGMRWQGQALEALQMGAEYFLTDLFFMSQAAAVHAKRATVLPKDMNFVDYLKNGAYSNGKPKS